ncbi:MAG: BTAD domain-containing putative transcriptional regulator [Bacillota bacterium]|nr:BTAD domain-containing putative transcriptional regulator [Bacillota bacterium]
MAKIEVFMLGQFSILADGEDVIQYLGNSKKKISLLQYLLVNKDVKFTNFNLFEHLWPSDDSTNPESALKTLVSRLRKDLRPLGLGNLISTKHGVYQWNDDICDSVDIYTFSDLATKALTYSYLSEPAEKDFEKILLLYQGDLLVGYDTESWIVPRSMHYHTLYLNTIYKYIALLSEEGKYNDILRVARRALEIDKFDSKLNLELMTALLALNLKTEALTHYNYTVNLHYTQLGTKPSEDILNFYKELIKVEHDSNASLQTISEELENDDENRSAFVCDYSIFKDIYRINMRNLQRLDITIFLGVITLSSTGDATDGDLILLDKVMGFLEESLRRNLRKGDTISRYGPSQFAVLLPTANHKTGALALERVKNAFYKDCPIPNFIFSYKLKPLIYENKGEDPFAVPVGNGGNRA